MPITATSRIYIIIFHKTYKSTKFKTFLINVLGQKGKQNWKAEFRHNIELLFSIIYYFI